MQSDLESIGLPTLPYSEPSLPTTPSFVNPATRKRPFLRSREPSSFEDQLASAINTSSDPAIFSSDDTPDAENYSPDVKRRKKKIYEGTWWGEKVPKRRGVRTSSSCGPKKKRSFRRNFDSGIFMGDDSSATDLSSEGLLELELFEAQEKNDIKKRSNITDKAQDSKKTGQYKQLLPSTDAGLKLPPQGHQINDRDLIVKAVVQRCLDKNDENVDCTSMGLDSLPTSIKELKSMIKRIHPEIGDSKLAPFEAELKVYLGNNNFSRFPPHLLELTNIRLLSLRQNSLAELPPGIRNLCNLQDLNLSSNSLEYLPFEIVQLLLTGCLKTIHESPNPWKPTPAIEDQMVDEPFLTFMSTKKLNLYRIVVSKPEEIFPDGNPRPLSNDLSPGSQQPHLSEVILRSLLRHNTSKADLSTYLTDSHPDSTKSLLKTLHAAQLSGGRACTFCSRDMVLPRWQWYEWWSLSYSSIDREEEHRLDSGTEEEAPNRPIREYVIDYNRPRDGSSLPTEALENKPIPFQRMACGCVDVKTGLRQELMRWNSISYSWKFLLQAR